MAAPMDEPKSKKSEKITKKMLTMKHRLNKDGINITSEPTKIICVSNAGLGNDVPSEIVRQTFGKHGHVCDIIMLPRKPYAFVCYDSIDSAEVAMATLNGSQLCVDENRTVVIYVFYVTTVPASVISTKDLPTGLILLPDYITPEYEIELLHAFADDDKDDDQACQGSLKHRRVQHYGYEFLYGTNNVDPASPLTERPIPAVCDEVLQRLLGQGHITRIPDQLTVNTYQPGQGIPAHVDTATAFEDGIVSVSLASQVVMDFYSKDNSQMSVLLPRRSVMVMTGDARYGWSHGITPRKSDIVTGDSGELTLRKREMRVSLTFRKVVQKSDVIVGSGEDIVKLPSTEEEAARLESQHVKDVYSEIASHYSDTRHTPWPSVKEYITQLNPGTIMLDVGCGNGKYLGINKNLYELGCDQSAEMARLCESRGHCACVGSMFDLPIRSGSVDVCICVAALHHVSTPLRRLQAVTEMARVLRKGGQLFIQVWAMEQNWGDVPSKYIAKNYRPTAVKRDERDIRIESTANVNEGKSSEVIEGKLMKENYKEDNKGKSTEGANITEGREGINEAGCNKSGNKIDVNESATGVVNKKENLAETGDNLSNISERNISECQSQSVVLKVHKNRTQFEQQDLLVPWHLKGNKTVGKGDNITQTFHRYYHIFWEGELADLCSTVAGLTVEKTSYDNGNWCVVCRKE